jgi:hypothetical protein
MVQNLTDFAAIRVIGRLCRSRRILNNGSRQAPIEMEVVVMPAKKDRLE